jgi:hypothetical protein
MSPFNPLDYRACSVALSWPTGEPGTERAPLALLVAEICRPRMLVGVAPGGTGAGYRLLGAALRRLGLTTATRSFASSDPAPAVAERSVDVLVLEQPGSDGGELFARWAPTLSERAIVWHEPPIDASSTSSSWLAGSQPLLPAIAGLTLLAVGGQPAPGVRGLLALDESTAQRAAELVTELGRWLAARSAGEREAAGPRLDEDEVSWLRRQSEELLDERLRHEGEAARLRRDIAELHEQLRRINRSISFRLGVGATAPLRWIAGRLLPPKVAE